MSSEASGSVKDVDDTSAFSVRHQVRHLAQVTKGYQLGSHVKKKKIMVLPNILIDFEPEEEDTEKKLHYSQVMKNAVKIYHQLKATREH